MRTLIHTGVFDRQFSFDLLHCSGLLPEFAIHRGRADSASITSEFCTCPWPLQAVGPSHRVDVNDCSKIDQINETQTRFDKCLLHETVS